MNRFTHTIVVCLAVIVGASALTLSAAPAEAAPSCADRVVADWSDNGRVDRLYALECYEDAIDTIPVDLRDYTNAADVIARALTAASRDRPPSGGAGTGASAMASPEPAPVAGTSSDSSVPLALILLVVVSSLVLVGGATSHLARRHRTSRTPGTAAD
ncbi:MAG: hypothetical protein H0U46_11825 [Actinobacteria bacterium]|nr:hypothetical protein [Actinomycetota bacterium]